jgi:hypothetical protein
MVLTSFANAERPVLSKVTSVPLQYDSCRISLLTLSFSRPEQTITTKISPSLKQLDLAIEDSKRDVDWLVRAKLRELVEVHEWNDCHQ